MQDILKSLSELAQTDCSCVKKEPVVYSFGGIGVQCHSCLFGLHNSPIGGPFFDAREAEENSTTTTATSTPPKVVVIPPHTADADTLQRAVSRLLLFSKVQHRLSEELARVWKAKDYSEVQSPLPGYNLFELLFFQSKNDPSTHLVRNFLQYWGVEVILSPAAAVELLILMPDLGFRICVMLAGIFNYVNLQRHGHAASSTASDKRGYELVFWAQWHAKSFGFRFALASGNLGAAVSMLQASEMTNEELFDIMLLMNVALADVEVSKSTARFLRMDLDLEALENSVLDANLIWKKEVEELTRSMDHNENGEGEWTAEKENRLVALKEEVDVIVNQLVVKEVISYLIVEKGANANVSFADRPLVLMAEESYVATLLVELGASVPAELKTSVGSLVKSAAVLAVLQNRLGVSIKYNSQLEANVELHKAVRANDITTVRSLLSLKEDVNEQGEKQFVPAIDGLVDGTPCIFLADKPDMLTVLHKEFNANLTLRDHAKLTLLHSACLLSRLGVVEYLLQTTEGKEMVNDQNNEHQSPPLLLCRAENVAAALMQAGCDLTLVDATGNSALHWFSARSFTTLIPVAFAWGLTPFIENYAGARPLSLAGSKAVVDLLLNHCGDNEEDKLKLLSLDANGYAPLHAAALQARMPVVAALLEHNSSLVDTRAKNGKTPLMLASSPNVCQMLLASGADPNAASDDGCRALHHFAKLNAPLECFMALLAQPSTIIDPRSNVSGVTPLMLASSPSLVDLLVALGADPLAKSFSGASALHVAAALGHAGSMEALLKHINQKNGVSVTHNNNNTQQQQQQSASANNAVNVAQVNVMSDPANFFITSTLIELREKMIIETQKPEEERIKTFAANKRRLQAAEDLSYVAEKIIGGFFDYDPMSIVYYRTRITMPYLSPFFARVYSHVMNQWATKNVLMNNVEGRTPFMASKDANTARSLLMRGANFDARVEDGRNAVHVSAQAGAAEVAVTAIVAGAGKLEAAEKHSFYKTALYGARDKTTFQLLCKFVPATVALEETRVQENKYRNILAAETPEKQ